jgi:hypothetical protein
MKPIEAPLDKLLRQDAEQCICYKLPTHPDGWVIQGLGQITVEPADFYRTLEASEPMARISEPSGLILPIVCTIGITLISSFFEQ